MKTKMYCSECVFLKLSDCEAKGNQTEIDDYFSKRTEPNHKPSEINANNDCGMFMAKSEVKVTLTE